LGYACDLKMLPCLVPMANGVAAGHFVGSGYGYACDLKGGILPGCIRANGVAPRRVMVLGMVVAHRDAQIAWRRYIRP
jgi:hypothetical protein